MKLPKDPDLKLIVEFGEPLPTHTDYQHVIGKLIYLTITRPDITFAIHILCQFMQNPTCVHMQVAKRVLRYLLGTVSEGVFLAFQSGAMLTAYTNSDWASCPLPRKSTTGFCCLLGSSLLSWKTKKRKRCGQIIF